MKRTFSTLVESVKRKKWKPFVAMLCVVVLLVTLAAGCRGNQPMAPDGVGGDSPGVTTTTTAATTATIKDEPLATTTGTEMTGAITTTTVNTSSSDKTATTTQGGSASVTKTTASKPTKTTAAKTTKTKATKTTTATKVTAGKQSYLDTSKLTYTQEDVGKVVGYSRTLGKDITVVKVKEGVNGSGLKYVRAVLSDGTSTSVVECEHCHEMPCPDGGGEACSEYDAKLDGTKTCQRCGLPKGDGHNGTCLGIIDWDTGKIICHHYD